MLRRAFSTVNYASPHHSSQRGHHFMSLSDPPTPTQACLDRLAAGDPTARNDLYLLTRDHLLSKVRAILNRFPHLRRWEGSDDVLHNAVLRLDAALSKVDVRSTQHYLALAARTIRHELIDLLRHHFGAQGLGGNHATPLPGTDHQARLEHLAGHEPNDPAVLAEWAELHEKIGSLDPEQREVFDLHWYHGLTLQEVATTLGDSLRTVNRRWVAAKLQLAQLVGRELPVELQ